VYSGADKSPVPGPSQDFDELRADLDRATAAGDWLRVVALAQALAGVRYPTESEP